MSLLGENDAQDMSRLLKKRLDGPVTIEYFTSAGSTPFVPGRACQACYATGRLLEEVAALSDNIRLNVHDFFEDGAVSATGVDRIPAIIFEGGARAARLRAPAQRPGLAQGDSGGARALDDGARVDLLKAMRGNMTLLRCADPAMYERVNYMLILQLWRKEPGAVR